MKFSLGNHYVRLGRFLKQIYCHGSTLLSPGSKNSSLLPALPSDVRKGFAFPASSSLILRAASLSLTAGENEIWYGKPEAFRTSGGIAARDRTLCDGNHSDYRGRIRWFVGSLIPLVLLAISAQAQPKVTVDHNSNKTATAAYKFPRVPSPARNDAGAQALLTLVDAEADGNSADLSALNDGLLPTSEDQPRRNFFLNTGSGGGRLRMDLGSVMEISQVNSYSWHTGSRGPQVYRLWASDGAMSTFNAEPKGDVDPASCGWISIVIVDTRTDDEDGGQYGVSITDARGVLGKFRYLLFDLYPTEIADTGGNTFYSEIDVVAKK